MKKILLIGGAGYIGTVLTLYFLKRDYKVVVLDKFIYGNQFAVQSFLGDPDYTLINGDLSDHTKLHEASQGVTDVILLGGLVGDPITKKYPVESGLINDKGIKKCMDYFDNKDIRSLIFISTCSNYGLIKNDEIADENFELNPLSLYAKAKVSNERYLLEKKNKVTYRGIVLRFATAFGLSPRMRFDLTISEFTKEIYSGNELMVFDENTWRPYCHVQDFARILELVIKDETNNLDFEVFNAGGDMNNFTKKMIVDEIVKRIPSAKVIFGNNGSDPRNYRVSFKKINEVLGFKPQYSVQYGIDELISALKIGMFSNLQSSMKKYGNYELHNVIV